MLTLLGLVAVYAVAVAVGAVLGAWWRGRCTLALLERAVAALGAAMAEREVLAERLADLRRQLEAAVDRGTGERG